MRFDQILEWLTDWYELDQESLKANTQKDEIRHENLDKLDKLKEMLTINKPTDDENLWLPIPEWKWPGGLPAASWRWAWANPVA